MNSPSTPGAASPVLQADALKLFQQLLPALFFCEALRQAKVKQNNRVYTAAVVMWLMILQRWQNGTSQSAVVKLLCDLPASFWPYPCKRLQPKPGQEKPNLSSNPGGYHQARKELPTSLVEKGCDLATQGLIREMGVVVPELGRQACLIDGSTSRLGHSPELCELYPPTSNQHGKSHWPILRLLVMHDLITGLAMRPVWGPVNGKKPVSEQALLERALVLLPDEAVLLGDSNFGVFSVAYAADQSHHPVLLRLTLARAQSLYRGRGVLQDGIDQRVQWKPSRDDRRRYKERTGKELPADAAVSGRLIVRQVQPSNGKDAFLLPLFTTLETDADVLTQVYGRRWNIETDLRTLKTMLRLDQLTCTLPEMVDKEIPIAILAYNLVRAVTYQAAQKAGLTPRDFSFTRVRCVIDAFLPAVAAAGSDAEAQKLRQDMMYYVGQARLPKRRKKRRSYPRAVWPKPKSFPANHG